MKPTDFTFVSVLSACDNFRSLRLGKLIHSQIIKTRFDSSVFVGNALVDMYAKCGDLDEACLIFERIPNRNVISWTTMIAV